MAQSNAQIQATIDFIERWVKKFSFLFVRYKNWSISTTFEWYPLDGTGYPVSYDAGSYENAKAVKEYFITKGMKVEIKGRVGQHIHLRKTYSI